MMIKKLFDSYATRKFIILFIRPYSEAVKYMFISYLSSILNLLLFYINLNCSSGYFLQIFRVNLVGFMYILCPVCPLSIHLTRIIMWWKERVTNFFSLQLTCIHPHVKPTSSISHLNIFLSKLFSNRLCLWGKWRWWHFYSTISIVDIKFVCPVVKPVSYLR